MAERQSRFLVGQFDDFVTADGAVNALRAVGFASDDIEQFALNAPGQHDRYPIGGDEDADRGARGGEQGAATGVVAGSAAGIAAAAAALPVAGPLAVAAGAAAGAYAGAFAGAVHSMGTKDKTQARGPVPRPAGVRVVVHLHSAVDREHVLTAFRAHHVQSIEEAEGTWRNGSWVDFDPVSAPRWVVPPQQ